MVRIVLNLSQLLEAVVTVDLKHSSFYFLFLRLGDIHCDWFKRNSRRRRAFRVLADQQTRDAPTEQLADL
jgi:hypothetical protein